MTKADHLVVQALAFIVQDATEDATELASIIERRLDDHPLLVTTDPILDVPLRSKTRLLLYGVTGPGLRGVDPLKPDSAPVRNVEPKFESDVDRVAVNHPIDSRLVMK
tara:strand:+ start:43 stop:366 length:324 start_codon:yes stop_codon:yes gene_type:complete